MRPEVISNILGSNIQQGIEQLEVGIQKYGTTVDPLPLRQWLQHALEESLDMVIHIQRAIEHIDRQQDDGK